MLPEGYEKLFMLLHDKTMKSQALWKETNITGKFQLAFSSYTILLEYYDGGKHEPSYYSYSILNENGVRIESFGISEFDQQYDVAAEMYYKIRSSALKIDEAIDEITSELMNRMIIGDIESINDIPKEPEEGDNNLFS